MDFLLTYTDLLTAFIALALIVIAVIFGTRVYLKHKSRSHQNGKHRFETTSVSKYNKYKEVDGFKLSGTFFRFGVFIALAGTFFSFSATEFDRKPYVFEIGDMPMDMDQLPPRTEFVKPLPPPPPPPKVDIVEVPEDLEVDQPDFIDDDINEDDLIEEYVQEKPVDIPPPPPPPIIDAIDDVDDVFVVVEQNPRFPGCEGISGSRDDKENCARKKLLEYIYNNLTYPSLAVETGIEGTVVIQFVVNKTGMVEDINLVRGIGGGCDQEAVKVVKNMNTKQLRWTPGKQRNKEVKVKFTLPIKFKLQN